jgi:hypothetical protein
MTDSLPTEKPDTNGTDIAKRTLKRRGLLAAAWATVAAIVAKQTTNRVEAANGGPALLGASNTQTLPMVIENTTANAVGAFLVDTTGTQSLGLVAEGGATGVAGYAINDGGGAGVFGFTSKAGSFGLWGINSNGGVGVRAESPSGTALLGVSATGVGAYGQVPATSTANAIAVYGANFSSYEGPGPGAGGFGVYGHSAKGHGLVGATSSAGGAAVVGATNGVAGAYAAALYGPVLIGGALTVYGAKSAAVPHPDGSHRLMYCVEAPESWFEDFGKGRLECGQADVTIDPDFAAVANMEDYHVFVTVYGQPNDLIVDGRTSRGFRLQAGNPASTAEFSWRVVAKRKDIVGERLAKVTMPTEPALPTAPPTPEPAPPADHRSRRIRS